MSFNDDEQIVATQDVDPAAGLEASEFVSLKTTLRIINKPEAPLEETQLKVMLELKGQGNASDRPTGVDIVMVLDVSGSMEGDKLEKMKIAMKYVIRKLSPIDRLSVVTFSGDSMRLCPLRQMTQQSQEDIEELVENLEADGNTNMSAGLKTALQVLSERTVMKNRVAGIMLMSDGQQNTGGDAAQVPIGNFPVHTFGFGEDHDPEVLKAIADKSIGGTFSDVQNTENLSIAFSQCLAGLLTVAVQDLQLVVTPQSGSKIEKVCAGTYKQTTDKVTKSVTVTFDDLYQKETRKVIVDLLLPASKVADDVLKVTYSYRETNGKRFDAILAYASVSRSRTAKDEEKEEVIMEDSRIQVVEMIKEARLLADNKMLDEAQDKLVEAQEKLNEAQERLENVQADDVPNELIDMLKYELDQLLDLMKSQQMYDDKGRPFALSSESSHDRQRFAARGDVEKLRLFSTPRMDAYLEEAKSFIEDQSIPLTTADEDAKQERKADPLGPVIGTLGYYIQMAIQSLRSIQKVLTAGAR